MGPPTISYQATDIADLSPGEDLWHYDYAITGPLGSFESINLLFSPNLWALTLGPADPVFAPGFPIDPDPGLGADGRVTLTAMSALGAADKALAGVSFVWLGGPGGPGAQAFEHLDDAFGVAGTGADHRRVSPIPEPSSLALMLVGGAAVSFRSLRSRRRGTGLLHTDPVPSTPASSSPAGRSITVDPA